MVSDPLISSFREYLRELILEWTNQLLHSFRNTQNWLFFFCWKSVVHFTYEPSVYEWQIITIIQFLLTRIFSSTEKSVILAPDEFIFPKPRFWQRSFTERQPLLIEVSSIRKKQISTSSYKSIENIWWSSCSLIPKLYPSEQLSYTHFSCTAKIH